jgi:hypothetical protein
MSLFSKTISASAPKVLISWGQLIDKITILDMKVQRLNQRGKRKCVTRTDDAEQYCQQRTLAKIVSCIPQRAAEISQHRGKNTREGGGEIIQL